MAACPASVDCALGEAQLAGELQSTTIWCESVMLAMRATVICVDGRIVCASGVLMYPHWPGLQMFVTNRRFPIFAAVHVQAPAELTFAEPTVTVPSKHCFMFADTPVAFIAVVQESAPPPPPPIVTVCRLELLYPGPDNWIT